MSSVIETVQASKAKGLSSSLSQMELSNLLQNVSLGQSDLKNIKPSDKMKLQNLLTPKLTKYVPHVPTPKQSAFLLLNCREAFYGGAAGGGKSNALLMGGLQNVDVKGYAGIIFRKTYADLVKPGALIDRSKEWLFKHDGVRWNDKDKRFEFQEIYGPHKETVSILQFGYLENPNDKYNYQGGEYQFIGFDELTHIDESNYRYMFSRLRRLKNVPIPLRVRGASNPPDDGGGEWVKKRFIDDGPSQGRVYIPAGMDDNPHLDTEEYEKSLEELDPVTRARLRDGNWEVTRKGNMFKRDWFQAVDTLPVGRRRCRYWDMASTDEGKKKRRDSKGPDYTAGFLLSEYNGLFYIEDIERVRMSPSGTEEIQRNIARADGYSTMVREEQEPGSSGVSVIYQKGKSIFFGYDYVGVPSTGNKAQRANPASAAAERGQIKYLRGCRNIEAFFDEAETFPGGAHDDVVDGFTGAFNVLAQSANKMIAPLGIDKDVESANVWYTEHETVGSLLANFGR